MEKSVKMSDCVIHEDDSVNEEYQQLNKKIEQTFETLRNNLCDLVRNNCRTYEDVKIFLQNKKREAAWKDFGGIMTFVIDDTIKYFEEEKDSLPLK